MRILPVLACNETVAFKLLGSFLCSCFDSSNFALVCFCNRQFAFIVLHSLVLLLFVPLIVRGYEFSLLFSLLPLFFLAYMSACYCIRSTKLSVFAILYFMYQQNVSSIVAAKWASGSCRAVVWQLFVRAIRISWSPTQTNVPTISQIDCTCVWASLSFCFFLHSFFIYRRLFLNQVYNTIYTLYFCILCTSRIFQVS